ncbi:P-loop containing nucleoside triphosphate hydrolase protein [Amylocarpus encephaloides]|uniref:DNA 3'-5' helicase n=1 Tax=Amylocarpus encephaloides TaxID=45428 RepID=A0A9P8C9H4_9HELO|nr:P-loop containing nucleoside triphosphate hydrolase protein [Amylocarpus encephaloides]
MSSSGITADDRALLKLYLKYPSALESYYERVAQVLKDNAAAVMEYVDKKAPAPMAMKTERDILLDQKKAYDDLAVAREKYRILTIDKKKLHHEIAEMMNEDIDTTSADERMISLGPQVRELEKILIQHLHESGAVNDGFGTGPIITKPQAQPPDPKIQEPPLIQSSVRSSQVVFQTQFPSLPTVSSTTSDVYQPGQPILFSTRGSKANQQSSRISYQPSPSPRRQEMPRLFNDGPHSRNSTNKPIRQPSFHPEPSPMNYGSDDELFDDLLAEESGLHRNGRPTRDQDMGDVEEDYGDFDDIDFLEVTQDFESRQHLQRLASRPSPKILAMENPRPLSNPRTRESRSRTDVGKKTMYSTMDPAHASMMRHPWSGDVSKALKDRFRLRGFRQNQLEAINATLGGKDAFILMPTGGGKSLCYQLPAVVQSGKTKGVTIVISPLLSLMSDQVDHLKKRNIQAFLVTGETSPEERNVVFGALNNPLPEQFIQLLYVTPEMVGKSGKLSSALARLHKNRRLARIVIDEAHCVSQWGHDFRPDYKSLDLVRRKYPGVPFIALTATATRNVKADCIHNLGMEGCEEYKQSFNRPNLHYEVRSKKGKGVGVEVLESMRRLILEDYTNQTGIIYTLSRKGCEDLASKLQEHGISAHHFHASMEPEQKKQVQRDWQAGKYQVVVATIAFGMGIDKPDVRFVIHHTIPKSLEGYYQETGRAGRDGKPSGCYLYYGYQDTAVLQRFIEESEGTEEVKERQREMLKRMVQFCEERSDCRRANILAYFGEAFNKEDCGKMCDNCTSDAQFESKDVTRQVQAAIKIVKALKDEKVTLLHIVDILRGSQSTKLTNQGRQGLDGYGVASNLPRHEVERMFIRLLMDRVFEEYSVILRGGFPQQYITLGPNFRDFEKGRRKIKLLVQVSESTNGAGNMTKQAGSKAEDMDKRSRARALPTSTMLTSPLVPSSHKFNQFQGNKAPNYDDDSSSDEAFEPPRQSITRQNQSRKVLGPPITTDDRMKNLPDMHRVFVHDFVAEAKKKEEHIRNKRGLSSAWFTESDFRAMAIHWTTTTKEMLRIPGINTDNVQRWGGKFVGLVEEFHQNYEDTLEPGDMDGNHKTVIDLVSDQETTDDEYGESDDASQAELPSKYFNPANPEVAEFNARVAEEQSKPTSRRQASPSRKYRGGSSGRDKFRSGKKFSGRRTGGSASGSATGSSRSFSVSGVARRGQSRRGSGMSKMATSSRGGVARDGNLMRAFGNRGDSGSRGGIGMMPT